MRPIDTDCPIRRIPTRSSRFRRPFPLNLLAWIDRLRSPGTINQEYAKVQSAALRLGHFGLKIFRNPSTNWLRSVKIKSTNWVRPESNRAHQPSENGFVRSYQQFMNGFDPRSRTYSGSAIKLSKNTGRKQPPRILSRIGAFPIRRSGVSSWLITSFLARRDIVKSRGPQLEFNCSSQSAPPSSPPSCKLFSGTVTRNSIEVIITVLYL